MAATSAGATPELGVQPEGLSEVAMDWFACTKMPSSIPYSEGACAWAGPPKAAGPSASVEHRKRGPHIDQNQDLWSQSAARAEKAVLVSKQNGPNCPQPHGMTGFGAEVLSKAGLSHCRAHRRY